MKKIEWINKKAASKAKKNATLEQQLPDMQVTVSELSHICEAAGDTFVHTYITFTLHKHTFQL